MTSSRSWSRHPRNARQPGPRPAAVLVSTLVIVACIAACGTERTGSGTPAGAAGGWTPDHDDAAFAGARVTGVGVHAGRCVAVGSADGRTGDTATSWTAPEQHPDSGASPSAGTCGPWTREASAAAPFDGAAGQIPAGSRRTGVAVLPRSMLVAVGSQYAERDETSSAAAAWTSADGGTTWTRASDPSLGTVANLAAAPLPPAPQPVVHQLEMLAVAATPAGVVAVGDDDGSPAAWTSSEGSHWALHLLPDPGPGRSLDRAEAVAAAGGTLVAVGSRTDESADTRLRATHPVAWTSTDGGTTWTAETMPGQGDAKGVVSASGTTTAVGAAGTRYSATPGTGQTSIPTVWTRIGSGLWQTTQLPGRGEADAVTAIHGRLTVGGGDADMTHPQALVWTSASDPDRFDKASLDAGQVLALADNGKGGTLAAVATGVAASGPGLIWEHS